MFDIIKRAGWRIWGGGKYTLNITKILLVYIEDFSRYWKYSLYDTSSFKKEKIETQMMLIAHSLEKGMSFEVKKKGWGKEKALALGMLIRYYIDNYSLSEEVVNGLNILKNYQIDEFSNKSEEVTSLLNKLLLEYGTSINAKAAGVKKVSKPNCFDKQEIMRFFNSRASIRYYSDEPISNDDIEKAMIIAYTTPSACNRQSSKVYSILDRKRISEILDLQYGNQGWADKAAAMFIITGSLSCFGEYYEREQVYIDGGLFAMNFVYGLHLNGIASCFKMFVRDSRLQNKIWEICKIPKNEVPIVIVMAGHYKEAPVNDPVSYRFYNKLRFVS